MLSLAPKLLFCLPIGVQIPQVKKRATDNRTKSQLSDEYEKNTTTREYIGHQHDYKRNG